ncbi:MAG: hypothetical protein ABI041_08315, partial [Bdellovibrionia bacterium]
REELRAESIKEAILTLSTGKNNFEVFSHPCPFKEGDIISSPLSSFDTENIMRTPPQETYIISTGDAFENKIVAKVIDVKIPLVCVGNIAIELGSRLPGDILEGEYIEFTSGRLDTTD